MSKSRKSDTARDLRPGRQAHSSLRSLLVCSLVGLFLFLLALVPHAFAFSNGQAASLVIGEPDLTTFSPGATSTGLVAPSAVTFDSGGNLWVADAGANRILEYKAPLATHEAASLVLGQPDFSSLASETTSTGLSAPNALAFDSGGNLWVVDSSNDRVVEYAAPFSTGEAASLVIGQPNFTSNSFATTTSTSLDSPNGVAFDSGGNLWVADLLNGRVLEFKMPFSTGEAASLVIGEPDFTTANDEVSRTGLNAPNSLAFDSGGNLWVVDGHRVLEYASPFSTGEAASLVIGQNTFTNSSTVTSPTGLDLPSALAFDSGHNLWVSDTGNNRVLEYGSPFSTGEAASLVIGQSNLTGSAPTTLFSPTSMGLNQPKGLAFDSSGNLWVADSAQGRVMRYGGTASTTSTTAATTGVTSVVSTATQSSSSSTTGGGGIPEFSAQVGLALLATAVIAISYVVARRGSRTGNRHPI
jgi:sugar lactone lactonase YvrE